MSQTAANLSDGDLNTEIVRLRAEVEALRQRAEAAEADAAMWLRKKAR